MRLLLLAVTFILAAPRMSLAEDCTLRKVAALQMLPDSHGLPLVAVTINGTERHFLVHIGGVFSAISSKLVDDLALKPKRITDITINAQQNSKITQYVTIPQMQVGQLQLKNTQLMIMPNTALPAEYDGFLSQDFLKGFDIDFDFGGHVLNLMEPHRCKGQVVYWTSEYAQVPFTLSDRASIVFSVNLDNQKLSGSLNPAFATTLLDRPTAKTKFNLSPTSPDVEPPGPNMTHGLVLFMHRFETLSFEGITVKSPLVSIYDANDSRVPSLLVGADILNKLHLYIAYKEKMLYVSNADAHQ